jgi:hypothetical protein
LLPATWGRIDFPALSVLDRRTAIDSVLVKDHQAHAQAPHRRHYGCCALQHPEAQARWRMLTLRLRDATTRPQCSLFVLWPSKATLTRNTNWRYFMTTAWASRRTRSAHICGSTCRRRRAEKVRQLFETLSHTAHEPSAERGSAKARTRVEITFSLACDGKTWSITTHSRPGAAMRMAIITLHGALPIPH